MKYIAFNDYPISRVRVCPVAFLGGYSGYLQTDGYDVLHQVTNVGCLAHVRRKLLDTKKFQGKGASAEKRKAECQRHAKSILEELYEWMTAQQVIESSRIG